MQKQKTLAKGTIEVTQNERGVCRLERLKEMLSKMDGVSSVGANHITHMLSVEYDPKKVTMDEIRKKVET